MHGQQFSHYSMNQCCFQFYWWVWTGSNNPASSSTTFHPFSVKNPKWQGESEKAAFCGVFWVIKRHKIHTQTYSHSNTTKLIAGLTHSDSSHVITHFLSPCKLEPRIRHKHFSSVVHNSRSVRFTQSLKLFCVTHKRPHCNTGHWPHSGWRLWLLKEAFSVLVWSVVDARLIVSHYEGSWQLINGHDTLPVTCLSGQNWAKFALSSRHYTSSTSSSKLSHHLTR